MAPRSIAFRTAPAAKQRKVRLPPPRIDRSRGKVPMPLYVQLVTLFRRRIESGEWPVGRQIPSLDELAEGLSVARATVRHAIGFLESEGLIGRYRGRGTFVLKRPEVEVWLDIETDWNSLLQPVPNVKPDWLDCRVADTPPTPSHAGGRLAESYQFMRRLVRRDSIPYLVGISYVERSIFKALGKKGFDNSVPLRTLQRHQGDDIGRAEQTVRVGAADLEVAHLLDVPLNSPIVVVSRSVFNRADVLIYESEGLFRGDFVRIRVRLR
jgi:GntR family transcriptional regulator